jgi:predicted transcriptional regulator
MGARIYHEFKVKFVELGIKPLSVANRCGIPYSTLSSQLNGYSRMSDHVYKTIVQMIAEKEREVQK